MKVGISKDEMYPVYEIVDANTSWAAKTLEVPQDLIDRDIQAANAFAVTQNEIEALFDKAT